MKIINILIFILIFIIPLIITLFTYSNIYALIITYFLWLTMEIGLLTFALFLDAYVKSKKIRGKFVEEYKKYKVAALVVSFNEDPETVRITLNAVKESLGDLGDTYLLDDSTVKEIHEKNKQICEKLGVIYVHRESRRGYKAGAINDFIKSYGKNYDIIGIFDVDQRPIKTFFKDLLPFFSDPEIAFVQIPQAYTKLASRVSLGAYYQQKPFFEVVMEGRNVTGSAFILGTGVLIRTSVLEKVGLLDESVVTEDLATSINIHSIGFKSIYVNYPGIWYGEAPLTVNAYLIQQGRWSLGNFQSTWKTLNADVRPRVFLDYVSGLLYWLKEGPLTAIEISAPLIFLIFHIYIIKVNPFLFAIVYYPIFLVSIIFFIYSMKVSEYGIRGFFYHQFLELIMMPSVILSFIAWILGMKKPFKVTPKGGKPKISPFVFLNIALTAIFLFAIYDAYEWYTVSSNFLLKYSIIVNLSWVIYFLFLNTGTFIIYFGKIENEEKLLIENKQYIS